ncbi:MAG: ribosome recycling factor [Candidatus Latescibacterota bacterium]|jgi:ribosome recycling factor|nr:MAG: ribosome recycling factor [Candidatus Latescibacterota bacterium]
MTQIKTLVQTADSHMKSTLHKLETELATIRTGKASPALLDGIKIDYYGNKVPLKQVANVAVPDPKLITVQPWEKPLVGEIIKAIQTANLGLNPQSDGAFIRVPVPPLTEERRRELVKAVKHLVEEAKIAVRNVRRDAIEKAKKLEKEHAISEDDMRRAQKEVQDLTDKRTEELDKVFAAKEKEIMSV